MFRFANRQLVKQSFVAFSIATVAGCSGGGGGGSSAPAPVPTSALTTQPTHAADAFVDSIGVNTHFGAANSPYTASAFGTLQSLLVTLGVRHVRDAAYASGSNATVCSFENGLGAKGITFTYITDITFVPADITSWAACAGSALGAFESVNEYDITHPTSDTNWPATLLAYQQLLFATVKQNATTAAIAVLAPSLTSGAAYQSLGSVQSYSDFGNIHEGFDGFAPGTTGYGANGYGSISYDLGQAEVETNSPFYATEAAFSTAAVTNGGDATTQAKYVPRVLFDNFNAGVPRTFYYELLDEPNDGDIPPDLADGLADVSLTPKPSFAALQSLIALLADPGATFTPASLTYGVSGATSDVRETVLQKRDGDFYLAIWRETSDFDPNALTDTAVAPETVKLLLAKTPSAAASYAYDTNHHFVRATLPLSTSIAITVTDQVSVVDLSGIETPPGAL